MYDFVNLSESQVYCLTSGLTYTFVDRDEWLDGHRIEPHLLVNYVGTNPTVLAHGKRARKIFLSLQSIAIEFGDEDG